MSNQERAALTFGMFAMCEAAEMLLAEQMNCKQDKVGNYLQHEAAMYYKQYADGIAKAYRGMQMFNERVADMYMKIGGENGVFKHDEIRRTAMEIIRNYIDARNYIDTKEDAVKWDAQLFNLAATNKHPIISSKKRDQFRIK